MTADLPKFSVSKAPGVRGVWPSATVRITREADAASILLHAIDPPLGAQIASVAFEPGAPDFGQPFVTKITGLIENSGRFFLVEPLPLAVPLLDVWTQILREAPEKAVPVARIMSLQLREALELLHVNGQTHGAVGVENVVLTASGIYGLLVARLRTDHGWLWLRPLRQEATAASGDTGLSPVSESVARVVHELTDIATSATVLSQAELAGLEMLRQEDP